MGVPCVHVCPCMAVPHEKPHIPSLSRLSNACRWVGNMPLGLFTMCLAWVSTCSLCFKRVDSDTCAWNPHVQLSPLSKHKEQVETHAKHTLNNRRGMLPTHLHAFERRDNIGMCGFSWGTAMHGRTTLHGTPMHGCPPYWNSIDMC